MPGRSTNPQGRSTTDSPPTASGAVQTSDPAPAQAANAHLGASIAHEQSARDRAALAAALDPIITIDARGTIQSASDSVQRVLGWTPAELLGQSVRILMPEPHHSAHDGYLANYHRTGQTNILNRPRRFDAMRKDGSLVPIELCVSRADIAGGGPPLFVGIIRDMSAFAAAERSRDEDRVRYQQQLAEQTSALQQANARLRMADRMASIGTLAAGLGHDMNNVLLPVRAHLNAVAALAVLPKIRHHIQAVQKSVAYLQQLADGLHFLALDPDTEEDHRGGGGATDLNQWWSQAGALLSKSVPKHVRVTASFPADLPPAAIAAHGLTQAVLNLIVNAGEAIPPPSERKRKQGSVRISAEEVRDAEGRWVQLSVTDNGAGMSEEVKRRAFEMFFTTKPRGLGTGLGLALVRKVMERARGRVEIDSELGKGTAVTMVVPAVRPQADGADAERPSAVISVGDGRAAGLIRHLLESSGAPVLAGTDPAPARIWVLDPAATSLAAARDWRRSKPEGRLVLFGRPDDASVQSWSSLNPLTIEAPDDLEAVRTALNLALSAG